MGGIDQALDVDWGGGSITVSIATAICDAQSFGCANSSLEGARAIRPILANVGSDLGVLAGSGWGEFPLVADRCRSQLAQVNTLMEQSRNGTTRTVW